MQRVTLAETVLVAAALCLTSPALAQETGGSDSRSNAQTSGSNGTDSSGDSPRVRVRPDISFGEAFRERCIENKFCSTSELLAEGNVLVAPPGESCDDTYQPELGVCMVQRTTDHERRITVAATQLRLTGTVPDSAARSAKNVVKARTPHFLSCYSVALESDDQAAGRVDVSIEMAPESGKEVVVDGKDAVSETARTCLRLAASLIELPPATGKPYTLSFTLELSQEPIE